MERIYPYSVFITALLLSIYVKPSHSGAIRLIEATPESVTRVQTALGYSTVVEFQSKPTQAVLGDQDAFKLEYIGNSVTLKPLLPGARSNLFIFTDFGRFTFLISTGNATHADFLVRVRFKAVDHERESSPKGPRRRISVGRKSSAQGFTLAVRDFDISLDSRNPRDASLLRFEVSSTEKSYAFQPASFGLKLGKKFIPIEQIYLDRLDLSQKSPPIQGTIAVLNQDWKRSLPLYLVFAVQSKGRKPLRLETLIYRPLAKEGENIHGAKTPKLFQEKNR